MKPTILIPIDESDTAQHTIDAILSNSDLLPKKIILLHVVDVHLVSRLVPDIQQKMVYDAAEKSGARILNKLAKQIIDAGFEPELLLKLGTPSEEIQKIVEEHDIKMVIIGRHPGGGGIRDIMFGSVANNVIRAVKCPVLLI